MKSPELKLPNDDAVNSFKLIAQRHPHIATRIEWLWGHRELEEMISALFMDTRDGARQGFDPEVGKALMLLWRTHSETFPLISAQLNKELDIWCIK